MSEPVLVRGETPRALAWCRGISALVALAGAGIQFAGNQALGTVLCVLFGGLWIALEIHNLWQRSRRMWIEDRGGGFVVTDRLEAREYSDEDVASISFECKKLYLNGVANRIVRTARLWLLDDANAMELKNTLKLDQSDPLGQFLQRLMARVQAAHEQALRNGEPIHSDEWRLDSESLHATVDRTEQIVPLGELNECGLFDGKMCVWRKGQDEALARFDSGSRNTCLLPALLAPYLNHAAIESEAENESGLGRVLFERRARRGARAVLALLAFVLGPIGLILLFSGWAAPVGAVMLLASAGLALWSYLAGYNVFRCHQRGVSKSTRRGTWQLRYTEVESFTYSATRHYHHGAYVGTHINLKFEPLPGVAAKTLAYNTTVTGEDASLEELRDFISRAISARLADTLASGQPVRWTGNLTFFPNAIEFRRGGFFGRKPAQRLLLTDYEGYTLDQGSFALFRQGEKKAVMTESTAAPNFFPGFYLLQLLLHTPAAESAAATGQELKVVDELEEV